MNRRAIKRVAGRSDITIILLIAGDFFVDTCLPSNEQYVGAIGAVSAGR